VVYPPYFYLQVGINSQYPVEEQTLFYCLLTAADKAPPALSLGIVVPLRADGVLGISCPRGAHSHFRQSSRAAP